MVTEITDANKVHLVGEIINVKTNEINEFSDFILCVTEAFVVNGYTLIQHDSFPITYFHKGKDAPSNGQNVEVVGKLRNSRYIDDKGQEIRIVNIITSHVEIIEDYGRE